MKLSAKVQALTDLIAPAVAACDVALWGVEFRPQGKRSLLRIYVDLPKARQTQVDGKPASVGVDDCKRVSHQVSGLLDVHDPIAGEYVLEVSSPGWDRTFFSIEQMTDYIGSTIALRLISAVENRRKMTGVLTEISDNKLTLSLSDVSKPVTIATNNIDKASLVYQD